jgi:ornithine carbamoyltransferase
MTMTKPGSVSQALAGRRIGLICESRRAPAAALFIEAAEGLGAQVAVLHATDVVDARAGQQDKLVRMLSRLYDVIECQDLPATAVRHIAELVAVPVLANLGARALEEAGAVLPEPGTPAWEQGLAQVRQALLMAL